MKIRKSRMVFLCCLCFAVILGGCTTKKETEKKEQGKGTVVYYTNKDCTKLVPVKKKVKLTDNSQKNVEHLLLQMKKNRKDSEYRSAVPDRVIINNVVVSSNIIQVDFSTGYKKIDENEDLICRAGIVYTLTQLDGLNYVSFSINGNPMLDTDGKAIGALGRDSFVFGELPMK